MAPFTWTGERMLLKLKISVFGTIWNWLTSMHIFFSILFEIKQMDEMIGKKQYNGVILAGPLLVGQFAHLAFKWNIHRNKDELCHVINQVLEINSNWGRY